MERIFYPIGQGAFYAERFTKEEDGINFNMVYDCGACTDPIKDYDGTPHGHKVVTQTFNSSDIINVLFISHLDTDHVNEIKNLCSTVKCINIVMLPMLQELHKEIAIAFYQSISDGDEYDNIITLLNNPDEFFKEKVKKIIRIEESNDFSFNGNTKTGLDSVLDGKTGETIKEKIFSLDESLDWVYIPYNHDYSKRLEKFLENLRKEGIDISTDLSDKDEILGFLTNLKNRKKLKKAYENLQKGAGVTTSNINANSLILYSGPMKTGPMKKEKWRIESIYKTSICICEYRFCYYKPACIYTGDSDINEVDILFVFSQWKEYIGTIQIPHHGSLSNFNIERIPENVICPISVGKNNGYGHPSYTVIGKLMTKHCLPVCVTEDSDSGLVEIIKKI